MTHTPHTLTEDFPAHAAVLAELRQTDPHFARLAARYDELNGQMHRWETNIEPMEDLAVIDARKRRAALKDEIYQALCAVQPTS